MLKVLEQHLFQMGKKCAFGQLESWSWPIGHAISQKGVGGDLSKVQVMLDWPIPTTLKELKGFLGLMKRGVVSELSRRKPSGPRSRLPMHKAPVVSFQSFVHHLLLPICLG